MNNVMESNEVSGNNQKLVRDSVRTVIFASMVGTAIEFFDFYAYGTAAALIFQKSFSQKLHRQLLLC